MDPNFFEQTEIFEGKIYHSSQIKSVEKFKEENKGKTVLIIGGGVSGYDMVDNFVLNEEISLIFGESGDKLSKTSDYKDQLNSGKLKVKKGWKFKFDQKSITFEDGSSEHVDTVIDCTGFDFET